MTRAFDRRGGAKSNRPGRLLHDCCHCPVGKASGSCLTCRRWARYAREVSSRRKLWRGLGVA